MSSSCNCCVVVVINVDAYPYKNMFSGYTVLLDCKETKLGSNNQQTSSVGKNTRVFLEPFYEWKGFCQ